MAADPICTDPDKYQVIFENDRVRVLEYRDRPGDKTVPHRHPDSVMVTLSGFRRRLHAGQGTRDVALEAGRAHWLPAQVHAGENIGAAPTHVLFVELKETGPAAAPAAPVIGPALPLAGAEPAMSLARRETAHRGRSRSGAVLHVGGWPQRRAEVTYGAADRSRA